MLGMEERQGAIAFVPFGDHVVGARFPMGIGPEQGDLRADVMRGFETATAQDVGRHGRGRRLPVGPGYDDPPLLLHDCGESFRPADHGGALGAGGIVGHVARLDRGGINDQVSALDFFGSLWGKETQSDTGQAIGFHGADLVGPADLVTDPHEKGGQTAHSRPRHSDEMDPQRGTLGVPQPLQNFDAH